jgi:hypothetical protein
MADEKLVTPGGALDKLAKLLAAENIMVEHKPIKTAYFDIKNRVLALPMWKEMTETLYHMLVLHEVGHALETPAEAWKGAIEKVADENESQRVGRTFQGYLNVIEDARIERKIKTKFPGSRKDFIEGYDWLHQQDFFNIKNDDIEDLSLIDRINLYFKLGTRLRFKFTEEERDFVRRAEQTITFDDAVKLSEDLFAYAKLKKEEEDERDVSTRMDNEEDGEGEESDDFDNDSDDSDEGEPGDEGNDSDESDEKEDEDGDDSDGGSSGTEGSKTKPLDGPAEAKTDTAMNDRMEELLDASLSGREFRYLYFPKDLTHEEFVVGYKQILKLVERDVSAAVKPAVIQSYRTHLLNKFRIENSSAINYMVKEFEMKKAAQAYSRTKQSKTGVIDTNKIHSYKFNDDVFRRLNIVPNGKNHGLVVILDMSGSMQSNYRGAMDQLICLTMFCRRVGIPHRIYGFTSTMAEIAGISHENHDRTAKKNRLREGIAARLQKDFVCPDNEFDLVELFNEGMSLKDFNTMVGSLLVSSSRYIYNDGDDFPIKNNYESPSRLINGLLRPGYDMGYFKLGGTPLNDAILVSRDLLKKFRKEKNIQIMNFVCITDGESNCPQYYKMENGKFYHSPVNSYAGNRTNVTRIFIDEESKIQTTINFPDYSDITGMYARTVRQSQNATFVGFYIVGGPYDVRHVTYRYMKNDSEKVQAQFKKDKSAVVPKMLNFDEFYIIQGGKNLQAQQAKFDSAQDLKKGQLARAFISAQNKRGTSRAVLGRFIEKIAV